MLVFEGHLDIAYNALFHEREATWSVEETRRREAEPVGNAEVDVELDQPIGDGRGLCTVSLPELRAAGTAVVVTTLLGRAKPWVLPRRPRALASGDWPTQRMAHAMAHAHLAYYRALEAAGQVTLITSAGQLEAVWERWFAATAEQRSTLPIGLIVTMECADPIEDPGQLRAWWDAGLRALFLTHFGRGHYASGNPSTDPGNGHDLDGPVTPRGRELLAEMAKLGPSGMPLDLTHTSDTTFWDALELYPGPVYSSHANCRSLCDTQRQLTDEMIRAVAGRDGVLGVVLANPMIRADLIEGPMWRPTRHAVTMSHLADHVDHICQLVGNARQCAIGSDADGGFGAESCPHGFDRYRDLLTLAETLTQRGYSDAQIHDVFGLTWRRFYQRVLPV